MKCLSVRQPWAWLIIHGPFGFVLANHRPLPPLVVTGKLGLFDIDLED